MKKYLCILMFLVLLTGCGESDAIVESTENIDEVPSLISSYESNPSGEDSGNIFKVADEIENADVNSGMVQIGNSIYYIGDTLSAWTVNGVEVIDNTTGYSDATAIGYNGKRLCRIYLHDDGSLLLSDCKVKKIYFGIQFNADVSQSAAKSHLAAPEPIALAGGIYVGRDFQEIIDKYGSAIIEKTEIGNDEIKVFSFSEDYADNSPWIYVDRLTGKICGAIFDGSADL